MRVWLKNIRVSKNLTQNELANILCIDRSYYTRIEAGQRNPSIDLAKKISHALKFDWTRFYEDHKAPNNAAKKAVAKGYYKKE